MKLRRGTARPLLAGRFVPIAETLDLDPDPVHWVRINGAVQVVVGTALAIGRLPRLSALALAGSLVPTTLAGHRFWEEREAGARAAQKIQFLKNLSMLGGLLLASAES